MIKKAGWQLPSLNDSCASVARRTDLFHLSGSDEDRPLADVGDAVGETFQVVRRPEQVIGTVNILGIGHNVGHQFAVNLGIETIYFVVFGRDGAATGAW
jgi:hypothetical protein